MKRTLMTLVLLLGVTVSSFAHIWELKLCQSNTGVLTLYGQMWHPVNDCTPEPGFDGIVVNGTYYDWDYTTWTAGSIEGLCGTVLCSDPAPIPFNCSTARCSYVSLTLGFMAPGTPLNITSQGNNICFAPSAELLTACSTTVPVIPNPAPCGKNGNKVNMQHMTGSATNPCVTICIDPIDVASHLAHGDTYGECPLPRLAQAQEMLIAPNPNAGTFTVTPVNENTSVRVIDMMGKVVIDQTVDGPTTIDLSRNPKGLYFVEVDSYRMKMLVQ